MVNKKFLSNVRKNILISSHKAKSSHVGSCLSIVEILSVLYQKILLNQKKDDKTFILSKGHACLALYCVLVECKKLSQKTLDTYGKDNTVLMSHVSHKIKGVNFSTGSLGHGLPVAAGYALSLKLKLKNKKNFVLISDGELNEGTTWEALLFAGHHKLSNLVVIIDYNKYQSLTTVKKTLDVEPLSKKIRNFNCNVINVDGHNVKKLISVMKKKNSKKPLVIIAHTIKGKGISFMENNILWHYKSPNKIELNKSLRELDNA